MESNTKANEVYRLKSSISSQQSELVVAISDYRDSLINEAVLEILKVIEQGYANERELRLIISDAVRKSVQV